MTNTDRQKIKRMKKPAANICPTRSKLKGIMSLLGALSIIAIR